MDRTNRRQFLYGCGSTGLAAGLAAAGAAATPGRASVAQRVNVAILGLGEASLTLVRGLAGRRDCALRAVCDRVSATRAKAIAIAAKVGGAPPAAHADPRSLLDDTTLGAVFVAGALSERARLAALALEAGKHVYIEMPATLDPQQEDALASAAARQGLLCQAGLRARSMAGIRQAIAFLHAGKLGTIRLAWAVLYRRGKADDETALLGRLVPLLDLARWGLGVEKHPFAVTAMGGRFTGGSDATPDTLAVSFEYPERRLLLEVRSFPTPPLYGLKAGAVFHGDKGTLVCTVSDSAVVYGLDQELLRVFKGSGDPVGNFLRAVRDGSSTALNAPLADGLTSSALATLALKGVAQASREPLPATPEGLVRSDPDTRDCFRRLLEHLTANRVPSGTLGRVWRQAFASNAGHHAIRVLS